MARPNLAEKDILNPSEAIEYFVLSRRKFYDLLNDTDGEKGKLNEDGTLNLNPNSLTVLQGCKLEKAFEDAKPGEAFQFLRNGFFCVDSKDSTKEHPVYNRIVSLKSSYKPGK